MEHITVSVVMITYAQEKYIEQAIESVLMQKTNFVIELIIGDDHPLDNTEKIVANIIETHPKGHLIKYTRHKINKGIVGNMVWTMQKAKGEYIALCEGDDYWTDPNKLQKQIDFMKTYEDIVFSFHGASMLYENGEKGTFYKSKHFLDKTIIPKKYFIEMGGGSFSTASVMIKRKLVLEFPNFFIKSKVGDLPLALMAIAAGEIGYIEDIMCSYRVRSEGSWSKNNSDTLSQINHIKFVENLIEQFNIETNNRFDYLLDIYKQEIIVRKAIIIRRKSKIESIKLIYKNTFVLNFQKHIQFLELFVKSELHDLIH